MKIYIPSAAKIVPINEIQSEHIFINDIALALSKQCRYNGNVNGFYSVAEHCILLAKHATSLNKPKGFVLQILLHDAAEAYIGDIAYHIKRELPLFIETDKTLTNTILNHFMCNNPDYYHEIHQLDRNICVDEMRQLCKVTDPMLDGIAPLGITIQSLEWKKAYDNFISWFNYLTREEEIPNENRVA